MERRATTRNEPDVGGDAERSAWVLNLDADLELASPNKRYAPTRGVLEAMKPYSEHLAASLLGPNDVIVDDAIKPGVLKGFVGRAFCPTARAIALLERAGATPAPHPSHEVLRTVNSRAFCASLGQTLPDAVLARDLDAALHALAQRPTRAIASQWRVKRLFGMAGRGQRLIAPRAPGAEVSDADRAFLRAAMLEGGVQIEPDVRIVRELGLHGMLEVDGSTELGQPVEQRCDAYGQWLTTAIAHNVDAETREALTSETRRVAAALHAAGYFGPFGVDAFLYALTPLGAFSGDDAPMRLQPRGEINARYSMGFAVGFARKK